MVVPLLSIVLHGLCGLDHTYHLQSRRSHRVVGRRTDRIL